jgi:hypothetical protein
MDLPSARPPSCSLPISIRNTSQSRHPLLPILTRKSLGRSLVTLHLPLQARSPRSLSATVCAFSDDTCVFPLMYCLLLGSLTISGNFPDALVNVASLPIVVSSEYYVPQLIITPSAPNVEFTPTSQTLQTLQATTSATFTATYPTWVANGDSESISVQFTLSGTNAAWYNPLPNVTFSPFKSKFTTFFFIYYYLL